MSEDMKNTAAEEDINEEDVNTAAEEIGTDEAVGSDNTENAENSEESLAEKLEEVKDKLLRKAAEFDNFRKRTAKEKAENFALGVCDATSKLLPVLDNLERAIAAAETNDDKAALLEGIKMVSTQFKDALTSIGVTEIEAAGSEFDPEKHNAVMMEDSDKPSGTVTEELAKGYIYKNGGTERVIRHSMVKVAT